jgi:bisphosphoglycerate-dependent phosphoglycerate mutase
MERKALGRLEEYFQSILQSYRSWRWQLSGAIQELSREKDVEDVLGIMREHLQIIEKNVQLFQRKLEGLRGLHAKLRLRDYLEGQVERWRNELNAVEKEAEEDRRKGKIELAESKTRMAETYRRLVRSFEEQIAELEKLQIQRQPK